MVKTIGTVIIDLGEAFTRIVKFRKDGGYTAVDLSAAEPIIFKFKKNDGTFLALSSTDEGTPPVSLVGSGAAGDVTFAISAAQSALLKKGDGQNIYAEYTVAGKKTIHCFEKVLMVRDPLS